MPGVLNNLFTDISGSLLQYPPDAPRFEDYIWHLRRLGADRILFGSDYPANSTAESLTGFEKMGFAEAEQEQILEINAAKVDRFNQDTLVNLPSHRRQKVPKEGSLLVWRAMCGMHKCRVGHGYPGAARARLELATPAFRVIHLPMLFWHDVLIPGLSNLRL